MLSIFCEGGDTQSGLRVGKSQDDATYMILDFSKKGIFDGCSTITFITMKSGIGLITFAVWGKRMTEIDRKINSSFVGFFCRGQLIIWVESVGQVFVK